MNGTEQLLLMTEVAVALAGFAGIVAAYQFREGTNITRGDALGLAMLVNIGLVAAFFSLLPLAIYNIGTSEQTTWRLSSGLMCLNYCVFTYFITVNMKGINVRKLSSKMTYALLYVVGIVIFVVNALNAMNVYFDGEFGPFFISLMLPLIVAGYMFARLILRPLWRNIHEQEKAAMANT